jgi:hypothetical protein
VIAFWEEKESNEEDDGDDDGDVECNTESTPH